VRAEDGLFFVQHYGSDFKYGKKVTKLPISDVSVSNINDLLFITNNYFLLPVVEVNQGGKNKKASVEMEDNDEYYNIFRTRNGSYIG
jgi:hypothetical protein